MNSVMGKGMRLDQHHAGAWKTAFERFLLWQPVSPLYRPSFFGRIRPTMASMERQYPRTIAEYEHNLRATTRLRQR
jgi:hypothetical protein